MHATFSPLIHHLTGPDVSIVHRSSLPLFLRASKKALSYFYHNINFHILQLLFILFYKIFLIINAKIREISFITHRLKITINKTDVSSKMKRNIHTIRLISHSAGSKIAETPQELHQISFIRWPACSLSPLSYTGNGRSDPQAFCHGGEVKK